MKLVQATELTEETPAANNFLEYSYAFLFKLSKSGQRN